MKMLMVDFNSVDEDGLVRSRLDRASTSLFMYDMVLAYDISGTYTMAQVVSINGDRVKIVLDPASNVNADRELASV